MALNRSYIFNCLFNKSIVSLIKSTLGLLVIKTSNVDIFYCIN